MKCIISEEKRAPRTLLDNILRSLDHKTILLEGNRKIKGVLEGNDIDLIFLNWTGKKDLELIDEIKETYIFVTTSPDKLENMISALEAGADDFIIKPYTRDLIEERLEKIEYDTDDDDLFEPISELEKEHRLLERMANAFQVIVSKIDKKAPPNLTDWISSSSLVLDTKLHHQKEMYLLLKFLENAIKEQGESPKSKLFNRASLKSVEEEHQELKELIENIKKNKERYFNDECSIDELKDSIDSYCSLLYSHIEREDKHLFPLAKKYMYDEDRRELEREFSTIDEKLDEEKSAFERKLKKVEKVLGIEY